MRRQGPVPPERRADEEADERVRCANCAITIEGDQVERSGEAYCCDGCAAGGPCVC